MPAEALPQIRVLDDHVCNQIAAGEVIERPASVFKELVENAVDAGATDILVEVLQGGRKAVMVTDNGCGMDRDSCLLAVERHATSKIRQAEDIERIHSMGFRGEALAAITSVSRFVLESRPHAQLEGTRIQIDGGKLGDLTETGCPPGTKIEVRNLFYNTPARRKFLRTEATELAYIRTLFQTFAIAHPDVALRLQVDGRMLEHLPAQAHLADRIADIQGQQIFNQLRPVEYQRGELRIHGFIGVPTLHRSDRRDQVTLINRRPATAPVLGYAIRQGYSDSLPSGRNPVLFLHLEMPADWVDVNVHPTKREVRFGPSHLIRDSLMDAIASSLSPVELRDPAPSSKVPESPPTAQSPQVAAKHRQEDLPDRSVSYPPLPPQSTPPPPSSLSAAPHPSGTESPLNQGAPPNTPHPETRSGLWEDAEFLGSQHGFHLLSIASGFILMYPKAARERVLYEHALKEWSSGSVLCQRLLIPESVPCSPEEARVIREQIPLLLESGFELADFGENTFLLEGVPSWMQEVPPKDLIHALASELERGTPQSKGSESVREHLARSCCRIASVHQSPLAPDTVVHLLRQLSACGMPYTTPFGKPTLLHLSTDDFRRKFGIT